MHLANVLKRSQVAFGVAKVQVDVKEGGRGADLNVQLKLISGEEVNLSTAPKSDCY